MNRFTHGIMVLNPNMGDDEGVPIVHFIGLWQEPTENDINEFKNELGSDPEFGLVDIIDELEFLPADQEHVELFNKMIEESGEFEDIGDICLN